LHSGNDVTPALDRSGRAQLARDEPVLPGWHPRANRFSREEARFFLVEASRLNRFLSYRITVTARKRNARGIPLDFLVYAVEAHPAWERAWDRTLELLLETRRAAEAAGASYALVAVGSPFAVSEQRGLEGVLDSYPDMRGREWDLDLPGRRLRGFSASHGIPYLDLQPLFRDRARSGGPPLHWKHDGHWSAAGHDRAAVQIADFLVAREER
jgi:hypothetical protein